MYEQFVVPVQVHADGVHLVCLRVSRLCVWPGTRIHTDLKQLQTAQKLGAIPSRADEEMRNKVFLQYQAVDSSRYCRELHYINPETRPYKPRKSVWILAKDESMIITPAELMRFPENDSIMQLSDEMVVRLGMKGECSEAERIRWE